MLKDVSKREFTYNAQTQLVEDNLSELLNNTSDETFCYIGINQFVETFYLNNQNTEWDIFAIFQLGFPFVFPSGGIIAEGSNSIINVPDTHPGIKIKEFLENKVWSLFVFKKKGFKKTIIGFNNCNDCKLAYKKYIDGNGITVSNENQLGKPFYNESYNCSSGRISIPYIDYYKAIQKTIEKESIVERKIEFEQFRDVDFEFIEIPEESLYICYLDCLYRYKDSTINLFGYPNNDERISSIREEIDYIEKHKDIKQGDVLLSYISINRSERRFELRATIAEKDGSKAKCEYIMRPKTLSSYYILSYLKSDFLKELVLSTCLPESDAERFKKELQAYREQTEGLDELTFYKLMLSLYNTHNNDDDWEDLDFYDLPIIVNHTLDTSYFEKKYQWEKQQKLSIQKKLEKNKTALMYNENAKDVILRDMKELKECFNRNAYKAAIIMAGSILEAFLIDWLSELHDTNYFEEDYLVFDSYQNRYRRAALKDYISAIEDLNGPKWFEAAKKATEIRKKRNLVHAKLYINDNDISRETCTEVINFLENVINTRWQ